MSGASGVKGPSGWSSSCPVSRRARSSIIMFHRCVFIVLNNQIKPTQTLQIIGQQTSVRHKSLKRVRAVELIQGCFFSIWPLFFLTLLSWALSNAVARCPSVGGVRRSSVDVSLSAKISSAALTSDLAVSSCSTAGRTATPTSTQSTATCPR